VRFNRVVIEGNGRAVAAIGNRDDATILSHLRYVGLCAAFMGLAVKVRRGDVRHEAMIRNARHIDGAPQPRSQTEPGAGRAPGPNDPFAGRPRMARWREALFGFLLRVDARSAVVNGIPPEKVHVVDVPIER